MKSQIQTDEWTIDENETLSFIMRFHNYIIFSNIQLLYIFYYLSQHLQKPRKIKWIEIAKEFYEKTPNDTFFRNDKACREHWIPSLNKYF